MIRPITEADIPGLKALYVRSNNSVRLPLPEGYFEDDSRLFAEKTVRESQTLVSIEENRIAGVVCFTDDFLEALFVEPDFFGHGIGSELLKRALEGKKSILLNVYRDNRKAVSFYRSHAFKITSGGINTENRLPYLEMEWKRENS
ncbi:GNAT family N-acetyltransferase [bacterium]|nr:GNAT family N-acetyltransferase [bacterium]